MSHWDDRHGVSVALRLATQLFAALAWLGFPELGVPSLLAVLAIVWMTNLYNFMDGSDGLAAAMSVIGFGAYAWAAAIAGAPDALVSLAIAAATIPFLARNFPPARIFLGDVGAVPLGFMAAVLGLSGVGVRLLAVVVPAAGLPAFHRRCHRDARKAPGDGRECPARAPRPLLPAPGAARRRTPGHLGALLDSNVRHGGIGDCCAAASAGRGDCDSCPLVVPVYCCFLPESAIIGAKNKALE